LSLEPLTPSPEGVLRAETMLVLSDLLGGVLHEINNPLAAVVGQAQLLKERRAAGPDHVGLDRLSRAADRVADLGRSFVLLVREGASSGAAFSLNSEVEQTLPFFAYPLALRRVVLETSFASASPILRARHRDLRLLVVGLIAPGLESLLGGTSNTIRVATSRPQPGWARIEVSSPRHAIDVSLEPRVLRGAESTSRPSAFLADRLSRTLGGSLSVVEGTLRADLPSYNPAH